jgi:hypothetical protein
MGVRKCMALLCCSLMALQVVSTRTLKAGRGVRSDRSPSTPRRSSSHRPRPAKARSNKPNKSHRAPVRTVTFAPHVLTPEELLIPIKRHYTVYQGKTLHVKIRSPHCLAAAYTRLAGVTYTLSAVPGYDKYYECYIPFDCEFPAGPYRLIITTTTDIGEINYLGCEVMVNTFPFKKQHGFKISDAKLKRIKLKAGTGGSKESRLLAKYITNSPKQKLWDGAFSMPINVQRVTSPFGEIRTSHGMGHRHHRGLDLADVPRAPIRAANHGIVAVKTKTPVNGNVIAIDHGLGVFTLYCHMDSFNKNIEIGSKVTKDQEIGRIGMTGYASGYHLHLEMRVNNIAVDFMEWTQHIH